MVLLAHSMTATAATRHRTAAADDEVVLIYDDRQLIMDKYRKGAEKKLTNKVHPDTIAREALVNAEFSAREREQPF